MSLMWKPAQATRSPLRKACAAAQPASPNQRYGSHSGGYHSLVGLTEPADIERRNIAFRCPDHATGITCPTLVLMT